MGRDFFTLDNAASLRDVPMGGKIHFIGVCGVGMAQLATLLAAKGYRVSGSDKEFYDPMGSVIANSQVKAIEGYREENVPPDADLVVIGNAVSYGHPEVMAVERLGLPYTCFPLLLYEALISGKRSIVVAGTHGKTTTSAMVVALLRELSIRPSYFVGGLVLGEKLSMIEGDGAYAVVEGDEYDSAFFAKIPKFHFYKPDTLVITALQFDHADIYGSLEEIEIEFTKLVSEMKPQSTVVYWSGCNSLERLSKRWKAERSDLRFVSFGDSGTDDIRICERKPIGSLQQISVEAFGLSLEFKLPLIGEFNARNALAALGALASEVQGWKEAIGGFSAFRPVKRRQEVRFVSDSKVLIEDFAHHPEAVSAVIGALREVYKGYKVTVVCEPRSNTMKRKIVEEGLIKALKSADKVILFDPNLDADKCGFEPINVSRVVKGLDAKGVPAHSYSSVDGIKEMLIEEFHRDTKEVIAILSNGSFGGLIEKVLAEFPEAGSQQSA